MTRTERHGGEASGGKNKKHRKNKFKPKKSNKQRTRKIHTKDELSCLPKSTVHIRPQSTKPQQNTKLTEVHNPVRPFALAPCQTCGSTSCRDRSTCTSHECPVVIAVSSKSRCPTACGIFCNINSFYNTTYMLHGSYNRNAADLHTVIAALKQVHSFVTAKQKRDALQTKRITQIIIKTKSSWLVEDFAGKGDRSNYEELALEFDNVVNELGERIGVPPDIKFWRIHGNTMAQQLAYSTLTGWREANAQLELQA